MSPDRTLTPSGKIIQLTDSILLKPTKEFLMYFSAIIIQAYWRGFQVRDKAWYNKEGEKWLAWYENSAAKRIQKIWRGYKDRKIYIDFLDWEKRCGCACCCKECCADIAFEEWNKEIDDLNSDIAAPPIKNEIDLYYKVFHIEHDKLWIIDKEGIWMKKTPSASELPKPSVKWLIA